ncbi:gamma-mobile-trio protein GmtX [Pseudomonas sp. TH31]|uniref:gamma-mobile-trio protein GmtX n=1 Tax=Pseudomonas sp. TH31 TaxID=2796396 RepID=UPI00313C595A
MSAKFGGQKSVKTPSNVIIRTDPCVTSVFLLSQGARRDARTHTSVQLLPSLKGVLSDMEITALRAAVSDDFFDKQGWMVTRAGQVKGDSGEIYKHGYVPAIRKILKEIE